MRHGPRGVGHLSLGLGRLAPGLLLAIAFALPAGAQTKAADNAPPVVMVRPVEMRTLAPQSEYVGRLAVFDKVAGSVNETRGSAQTVLETAQAVEAAVGELRNEVASFLAQVAA